VLSFGWTLSLPNVQNFPAMIYTNDTTQFETLIQAAAGTSSEGLGTATVFQFLNYSGPLPIPSFDQYVQFSFSIQDALKNNSNLNAQLQRLQVFRPTYNNILYLGKLSFAPDTPQVRELIQRMNDSSTQFSRVFYKLFADEDAAIQDALNTKTIRERTWALIVFDKAILPAGDISYRIRMNYTSVPSTNTLYSRYRYRFDETFLRYYFSGFLSIQSFVSGSILDFSSDGSSPLSRYVAATGTPFPTPNIKNYNSFYEQVGPLAGFFMCMSMLYPVSRFIKLIVEEKESRMKETMKIMGLKSSSLMLSWFISYFVIFTLIAIICSILISLTFASYSSKFLVFILVFLFIISLIPFSFFVSVFFNKAKLAAIVGPVVLFALVVPRYAFFSSEQSQVISSKKAACLLSPTAFAFGADLLMVYEGAQVGMRWEQIRDDELSFEFIISQLFVDFFVYSALAWYFSNVVKGEYGANLPWYFPFQRSYWKSIFSRKEERLIKSKEIIRDENDDLVASEDVGNEMKSRASIQICNLKKIFYHGFGRYKREVLAVKGLNLDMYEGQITCLLGHNGAGKSTTISMITGLLSPTDGDCYFDGYSVSSDLDKIRTMVGICPQQNVIFETLPVYENLRLIGSIKGLIKEALHAEIHNILEQVGLSKKTSSFAGTLSGGMKRKLCLAMALIGNSKYILVDEPTSGMDPASRRSTWDLLRKSKKDRVILLTTHFMDEADLLGDRIAIMADGSLKCVGSSLFLKRKFGIGYNLSLVSSSPTVIVEKIETELRKFVSTSSLISCAGSEAAFRLPFEDKQKFPDLFSHLDYSMSDLSISNYGISSTTLEEVFIKVAQYDDAKEHKEEIHDQQDTNAKYEHNSFVIENNFEQISFLKQLAQLYWKRWICAKRDLNGRFFEVILPVILVGLTLLILKISFNPAGPSRELQLELFKSFAPRGIIRDAYIPYTAALPANVSANLDSKKEGLYFVKRFEKDSTDLSVYLLDTYRSHKGGRFAAYVSGDALPLFNLSFGVPIIISLITGGTSNPLDGSVTIFLNGSSTNFSQVLDSFFPGSGILIPSPQNITLPPIITQTLNDTANELSRQISSANWTGNSTQRITLSFPNPQNAAGFLLISNIVGEFASNSTVQIISQNSTSNSSILEVQFDSSYENAVLINAFLNATISGGGNLNLSLIPSGPVTINYNFDFLRNENLTLALVTALANSNASFPLQEYGNIRLSPNYIYFEPVINILHNTTSFHSLPSAYSSVTESVYRAISGNSGASLKVSTHPLPLTFIQQQTFDVFLSLLASLFVLVPFCYLPAAFVLFVVKERISKSQHLQLVSGASVVTYWVSTFLWDLTNYIFIIIIVEIIFLVSGNAQFVSTPNQAFGTFVLIFFFGLSTIPLSYLYSFKFQTPSAAQIGITAIHFVSGFVLVVGANVMDNVESTREANAALKPFYRLMPPYNLGEGLISLTSSKLTEILTGKPVNSFSWGIIGRNLVYMGCEAIFFFLLVMLIEAKFFVYFKEKLFSYIEVKLKSKRLDDIPKEDISTLNSEDIDVTNERENALSKKDGGILVINELKKTYPGGFKRKPVPALRDLSLSVASGQCFGFLGVNGAGKTTSNFLKFDF
jgi:ABC-type multidrug transport system ATPase subunit